MKNTMVTNNIRMVLFSFVLMLLPCPLLLSQQIPGTVTVSYPEVAREFQKYRDYPVSMATGIPDISIPLFDFKVNDYTIPFSLNYHSSGIKVGQDQGTVGCGWSLAPSFRITRVIHNRADEEYLVKTGEIKSAYNIHDALASGTIYNIGTINDNIKYLASISQHSPTPQVAFDTEYDVFTIQLPACSGNFILQKNNNALQAVKINSNALKIVPNTIGKDLESIEVTDENGILYKFGYYPGETPSRNGYLECPSGGSHALSWMLYKIVLPNSQEITFTYKNIQVHAATFFWRKDIVSDELATAGQVNLQEGLAVAGIHEGRKRIETSVELRSNNCFPLTVTSPAGRIDFEYQNANSYQLNNIRLIAPGGNEVKKIVFSRDANIPKRLASVSLKDGEKYRFEYSTATIGRTSSMDYWGYCNGDNGGWGMAPSMKLDVAYNYMSGHNSYENIGEISKNPVEYHLGSDILQKVIYPTGGYTAYSYEINKYYDSASRTTKQAGGLRIKSMSTYDPASGRTTVKTYKYGKDESGNGNLTYLPKDEHFIKQSRISGFGTLSVGQVAARQRETLPYSYLDYYLSTNMPVWYDVVTEYSHGGKTVYEYSYQPDEITDSYYVSSGEPYVKDYYSYISAAPELVRQATYKIENNTPSLLRETVNTYRYINQGAPVRGLFVREYAKAPHQYDYNWHTFINDFEGGCHSSHSSGEPPHSWYVSFCENDRFLGHPTRLFSFDDYYICRGIRQLSSTTETEYSAGGSVSKEVTFSYDASYPYNLKGRTESTNNANTVNTKYYYPYENVPGVDAAMRNLLMNNNRYSSLIQKEQFKGAGHLVTERISYKNYAAGLILPEKYQTSSSGGTEFRTEIACDLYDTKGNIRQVTTLDGVSAVYLWGYNYQYPIAEIKNATYLQVSGILTQALIDRVAGAAEPSASDMAAINNLRPNTSLNALVTTYTYKPLVGMLTSTNPSGIVTYYEYDTSGRLKETYIYKDNIVSPANKQIVQKYEYHYQNQ
jgi:YD repeat-containing protein